MPKDAGAMRQHNRTVDLETAFRHRLCDENGRKLHFQDLFFDKQDAKQTRSGSLASASSRDEQFVSQTETWKQRRVLVIFIRHFFCGNCQEYLRTLAAHPDLSPCNLVKYNLEVVVIGCGAPSLIRSYREITGLPTSWQLYADSSTELYAQLGMYRSLSLGDRSPRYIQRSLTGNMFRSVVQGIRRLPQGDILAAGSWDVNGGEFLFELSGEGFDAALPDSWKLLWYHRMINSRDHTEVDDLVHVLKLPERVAEDATLLKRAMPPPKRAQSSPLILDEDSIINEKLKATVGMKRRSSLRQSLSIRRQSWMNKSSSLSRSVTLRITA